MLNAVAEPTRQRRNSFTAGSCTMSRFTTSHRRHGAAFPLPISAAGDVEKGSRYSSRHRSTLQSRVAETLGVLHELEASVAAGRLPPQANSTQGPTLAQRSVIQHVTDTIAYVGDDDTGVSDQSSLCDLLKSRGYYSVEQSHARVPFRRGKRICLQKQQVGSTLLMFVDIQCFHRLLKTPNSRGIQRPSKRPLRFVLKSHLDPIGDPHDLQHSSIFVNMLHISCISGTVPAYCKTCPSCALIHLLVQRV